MQFSQLDFFSGGIFLCYSGPKFYQQPVLLPLIVFVYLQLCDGPIVGFTVLHNVSCNHGFIYITAQVRSSYFSFMFYVTLVRDTHIGYFVIF